MGRSLAPTPAKRLGSWLEAGPTVLDRLLGLDETNFSQTFWLAFPRPLGCDQAWLAFASYASPWALALTPTPWVHRCGNRQPAATTPWTSASRLGTPACAVPARACALVDVWIGVPLRWLELDLCRTTLPL